MEWEEGEVREVALPVKNISEKVRNLGLELDCQFGFWELKINKSET